jgi:hypothetical protein
MRRELIRALDSEASIERRFSRIHLCSYNQVSGRKYSSTMVGDPKHAAAGDSSTTNISKGKTIGLAQSFGAWTSISHMCNSNYVISLHDVGEESQGSLSECLTRLGGYLRSITRDFGLGCHAQKGA